MGCQSCIGSVVLCTFAPLECCLGWYLVSSIVSTVIFLLSPLLQCGMGFPYCCMPVFKGHLFPVGVISAAGLHVTFDHIFVAQFLATLTSFSLTQFPVENQFGNCIWHPSHMACLSQLRTCYEGFCADGFCSLQHFNIRHFVFSF